MMSIKFMFDTNIFDAILDGQVAVDQFPKEAKYFVTHIQKDEIEAIVDPDKLDRKAKLLKTFNSLEQTKVLTESAVFDVSKWDECKFTAEDNLIEELRKGNLAHTEDALIGETAIRNEYILVTNDPRFLKRVQELGGKAITFEQFLK